jgi:predicted metal-dependent phosphoesterase TrpH
VKVDYHLHTWCSDGAMAPADMLALIRREGVESFAITDHDTCAGWALLRGTPGLLCGVEATGGHDDREIHIVGLGIDPDHPQLSELLQRIRALREVRITALIARLPLEVSRGLTLDDVRDHRPHAGHALSRNHLARALVKRGGVPTYRDAFDRHLGDEYIRDPNLPSFPPVAEVTAAIRAAGGVSLLAHPGMYRHLEVISSLVELGCDGMEVVHPHLDPTLAAAMQARAQERGWLMSVGTDTHVMGSRRPGQCVLEESKLRPLLERLGVV